MSENMRYVPLLTPAIVSAITKYAAEPRYMQPGMCATVAVHLPVDVCVALAEMAARHPDMTPSQIISACVVAQNRAERGEEVLNGKR